MCKVVKVVSWFVPNREPELRFPSLRKSKTLRDPASGKTVAITTASFTIPKETRSAKSDTLFLMKVFPWWKLWKGGSVCGVRPKVKRGSPGEGVKSRKSCGGGGRGTTRRDAFSLEGERARVWISLNWGGGEMETSSSSTALRIAPDLLTTPPDRPSCLGINQSNNHIKFIFLSSLANPLTITISSGNASWWGWEWPDLTSIIKSFLSFSQIQNPKMPESSRVGPPPTHAKLDQLLSDLWVRAVLELGYIQSRQWTMREQTTFRGRDGDWWFL